MDAIVPAAGRGTRLRPLTDDRPKGLVPVDGTPIVTRLLDHLVAMDVTSVAIVVGYEGDQIVEHCGDVHRGVPITYVTQDEPLGLAHALAVARDAVGGAGDGGPDDPDDVVAVLFGDNVFDRPPRAVTERFRTTDADVVLGVERVPAERASRHAVCAVEGDRLVAIEEKPAEPSSDLVMTGALAGSRALLDACAAIEPADTGEYELADALEHLIDTGHEVRTVPLGASRVNVNTPADVEAATRLVRDSPAPRPD